jgi:hypothetical protein
LREFQFFVTDARYAVPSLHIVRAANEAKAREIAERLLAESPHHLGVEVLDDDGARLFAIGDVGSDGPPP